jgi:colanic acid/amylovoran biosynthesis glycosyltransferase
MNICIISESPSSEKAESFIKAHKELLEGNIHFLYGGALPKYSEKHGTLEIYPSLLKKIASKIGLINFDVPLISGLKQYLKAEKINVVLAEYGTTGAQVFPICKELQIPIIVHFHGYDISKFEVLKYHQESYKEMFDYASFIIAVSNDMAIDLMNAGASAEKIKVTHCGPGEIFFNISPNYDKSNVILAVGRMIDKKAPYYTIISFHKLLQEFPDLKLVMIGSGYLENAMRNLIKALGIEDKVLIKGWIDHENLMEYYQSAFCFVQHSIVAQDGDCEGTPVGILEASASGLPVVSTRHKGIKDVLVHGETGFIVDEHDVKSFTYYLEKIVSDRYLAAKLGGAAKIHIRQNFSMEKHICCLQSLIENLVLKGNEL